MKARTRRGAFELRRDDARRERSLFTVSEREITLLYSAIVQYCYDILLSATKNSLTRSLIVDHMLLLLGIAVHYFFHSHHFFCLLLGDIVYAAFDFIIYCYNYHLSTTMNVFSTL